MKNLNPKLYTKGVAKVPSRDGYGRGLVKAAQKDDNVVALCADLTESTRTDAFRAKFPERFVQVGVAEQNMAGVAAGMALAGKVPFISSYAVFSPGRNWDQIRISICYSNANVKIMGAHAGISVGPDGATHQALEDIAMMRVLPGITVIQACDDIETEKAVIAAAKHKGPVYIRFGREKVPQVTTKRTPFEIGRAEVFIEGTDVTIIAIGQQVYEAMIAARALKKLNISAEVINSHTIKPLDAKILLQSVKKTGAVVTAEEHQVAGGLGAAVSELLAQKLPTPQELIGMRDAFGESGEPEELLEKHNMKSADIVKAALRVLKRKKS